MLPGEAIDVFPRRPLTLGSGTPASAAHATRVRDLYNAGQRGEGNLELTYAVGVVYC